MHVRLIAVALLLGTSAVRAELIPNDQAILFELHVQRSRVEVLPRGSEDARFVVDASTAVQTSGGVEFSSQWSIDRDSLYLDGTSFHRHRIGRLQINSEGRNLVIRVYDRGIGATLARRTNHITEVAEPVVIGEAQFVRGYVLNFGGDVTVEGEVNRSVVSIGGDVEVTGTGVVRGNVVSIGGEVHKEKTASVYGDLYSNNNTRFRPRWYRDPDQNIINLALKFEYNRVTGALPWATLRIGPDPSLAPSLLSEAGYAFETELWHYRLGVGRKGDRGPNYFVGWQRDAQSDRILNIGRGENTLYALLFREDFGNYYFAEGLVARAGWAFGPQRKVEFEYANERLSPLAANANQWSLFGGALFAPNFTRLRQAAYPGLTKDFTGRLIYLRARVQAQSTELTNSEEAQWRARITTEYSSPSLESDFDYTRAHGAVFRNQPLWTNQSARLRVFAGSSTGALPATRQFYLGGLGSLRGYSHNEFFGDRVWLTNLEYVWSLDSWQIFALADAGQIGQGSSWSDGPILYDLGLGLGVQESFRVQIAWAASDSNRAPFVTARFSKPF
jgi:hypothetical protein